LTGEEAEGERRELQNGKGTILGAFKSLSHLILSLPCEVEIFILQVEYLFQEVE